MKQNCYVFVNCVSGNCPLAIEEELYGSHVSTCEDYCGNNFHGCDTCWFENSDICNDCIYYIKK